MTTEPVLTFPDFSVHTLSPGVYAVIAKQMTGSIANSGIIDLGDRTLVFDTFMCVPAARDLQQAAIQLTGRPATYVVNSHPHPDHVHGNVAFGDDAVIIASEATRTDLLARGTRWLQQQREEISAGLRMAQSQAPQMAGFLQRVLDGLPTEDQLRYPTLTYERTMTLHGSARSVELRALGAGHSPSDSILWLPAERIAFTADVIVSGGHLVMDDGDPHQWLHILGEIDALGAEQIVPGHGRVQTSTATIPARQYINDILDLAARAVQDGIAPEMPEAFKALPYPQVFTKNMAALMQRLKVGGSKP